MKTLIVIFVVILSLSFKVDAGAESISGQIDRCLAPFSEGKGSLSLTRYFFDLSTRTCKSFKYKGGTVYNFFATSAFCASSCAAYIKT
ncbi:hypothetical protein PVAND_017331 [Polypedilum vanderplanki]|uniref:BPTI/Kunitz inhibitor domain-containing protein n=1 Tax=Polypedilum vanderplanki TaxID=319348 RepID=A0A9J6BHY5_POLVA|nr:hypothetical protein PVAND_017331 [Polypedilum vanderplanki]